MMTTAITNWIQNTFTANQYIITLLVSTIPTIEVRGGITIAIGLGMNPWLAWIMSCVSGLIVCPILLLCLNPILSRLKRVKIFAGLAEKIEYFFRQKAVKLEKDALNGRETTSVDGKDGLQQEEKRVQRRKFLGIFLFVAFPMPLTGLWTGSAVAAFLGLKFHYSLLAIILGNFVCGLIITLLNLILGVYAPILLLVLAVFVVISIVSLCLAMRAKRN